MKRIPRNRAIEIVIQEHIKNIEDWIYNNQREEFKEWLYQILNLGKMQTDKILEKYNFYFEEGDAE